MNPRPKAVALLLATLVVVGCALNKSELRQDNALTRIGGSGQLIEPKRCAVQVAFLSRPLRDPAIDAHLWSMTDEQVVAPEVRQALEANGLRICVYSCSLPADVEAILNAPAPEKIERPLVVLPDGDHTSLTMGEPVPTASLLLCIDQRAYGKDYQDASGWYRVTAKQEGTAGVALRFVPEIHHGPIQHAFGALPNGGTMAPQGFMIKDGQAEETLRELAVTLTLQAGQVAVLGCLPDKQRSLGTFLFTQAEAKSDRLLQKVLLIWASRSTQGLPTLEPVDPPDMPQPQASRQRTDNGGKSASPKSDPIVRN
jgi:hypothetical protein